MGPEVNEFMWLRYRKEENDSQKYSESSEE